MKNNLVNNLVSTKESIMRDFSDNNIARIETEEIARMISRFRKSDVSQAIDEIDHAIEVFKSPVHIGEIGAYSSGKSALLNALYMLEPECRQPEGEGVVTSKVTYVCFREDIDMPEAYEIRKDGSVRQIEVSELQQSVGRTDLDNSVVDYYKMILPTNMKPFASVFAKDNIHLIDMPGFGGPYYRDQVTTKRYLRELDMLLVIIRADKIHQAGLNINSLVETANVPIIPVLTFYDLCAESDLYQDCRSDDEIMEKAKSLIRQEVPAVAPYLDYLVAVSSKTGQNISELRSLILTHIESSKIAIGKARKDISPVRRKQIAEFRNTFAILKDRLNAMSSSLQEMIASIVPDPKSTKDGIVSKAESHYRVSRADRTLSDSMSRGFNDLSCQYRDRIASVQHVMNHDSLETEIEQAEKDVNNNVISDWFERVSAAYKSYKDELFAEVKGEVEDMTLDYKTKEDLIRNLEEVVDGSILEMNPDMKIKVDKNYLATLRAGEQAKATVNFMVSYFKDPSVWVLGVLGLFLTTLSLPGILAGLSQILAPIGFVFIVVSVISFIIKSGGQKKQFFYETRQKAYEYMAGLFDANAMKECVRATVESTKSNLISDMENVLNDDMKAYKKDSEHLTSIKNNIVTAVNELEEGLKDEIADLASATRK